MSNFNEHIRRKRFKWDFKVLTGLKTFHFFPFTLHAVTGESKGNISLVTTVVTMVTVQLPAVAAVHLPWSQYSYHGCSTFTMVTVQLPWLQYSYHGYSTVTMVAVQLP